MTRHPFTCLESDDSTAEVESISLSVELVASDQAEPVNLLEEPFQRRSAVSAVRWLSPRSDVDQFEFTATFSIIQ